MFSSDQTATSAQLAVYIQMFNKSESYNISNNCGLLSDEFRPPTNYSVIFSQLYTNNLDSSVPALTGLNSYAEWSTAYNYINEENAIFENLEASSSVSDPVKKQLNGEAKFIRAFWHFTLS